MYLRRCYRRKDGKRHAYWALVESYRTARGPRQRVVAWLGATDERGRLGVKRCAERCATDQDRLFGETQPEWVEVDVKRVHIERSRKFGGPWLGLELMRRLELDRFLSEALSQGREEIPWPLMATILVLGRLCDAASELHLAERFYESSALSDLLSVPAEKINEDRLYRALDAVLPHKAALEKHLKDKLGELFELDYDLLLYDVTSTYFEGQAEANPQAQRGYSRDHRPDCKQVNIALVVSRCGMPLGYEIFAGNRNDATTLEEMVGHIEGLYGRASRIWVMDRGMAGEDNVEFLREGGRRYIVGTAKNSLRRFERELWSEDWRLVHAGLEVRITPAPGGQEVFILCRSAERRIKEQAMHERFEKRIEEGLKKIQTSCQKKKQTPTAIATRGGPAARAKHARSGAVPREGGSRFGWLRSAAVVKSGGLAGMGAAERRLVRAAQQRDRLEPGRPVAGLHSADRGRGSFSRAQVGPGDPAGVAPERRSGAGAHSGLLPQLRAVEDAGGELPSGGAGR